MTPKFWSFILFVATSSRIRGIYKFPTLNLRIHLWELTKKVDSEGYLILRHHTLTTLMFRDVSDFQMRGFNHQNALMRLTLTSQERTDGPSPYLSVVLEPAFGMGASFECLGMEVLNAAPRTENGMCEK